MTYLQVLVLDWQAGMLLAEEVINNLGIIEQLLSKLNQSQVLAQVVVWREQVAQSLRKWSSARFEHERVMIEQLLQQGDVQGALQGAEALLNSCKQAGEQAYPEADHDLAMAHFNVGRVLKTGGACRQALLYLQEAQRRFEVLGESGLRMASVSLAERGDCLWQLGQLDAAIEAYEEVIDCTEKLGDIRQVAAVKSNLASVWSDQKLYADALQGYQEAMELFQQLGEPGSVATSLHQMGTAYKSAGHFEQAEHAYRQSLLIMNQLGDEEGKAIRLNSLGSLYSAWNHPEQALSFYQLAMGITVQTGNKKSEGMQRSNIAGELIKLQRYNEARSELVRSIECKQLYGHVVKPWTTWDNLYNLEQACDNPQAAYAAWQKALDSYLAYRRDGGENHEGEGRLVFATEKMIRQGDILEAEQVIERLIRQLASDPEMSKHKNFLHKLQAIITGERNLILEKHGDLYYREAAELILLLERLEN